ncbi:MAG: hypothetical protein LBT44_08845 [Clostridiales bacterium]|nr:hypothetical protein [Clostridiales bacterium]
MIDIGKFTNSDYVKIITTDGMIFEGSVSDVLPSVEFYDEDDPQYDNDDYDEITIYNKKRGYVGIKRFEIQNIMDLSAPHSTEAAI